MCVWPTLQSSYIFRCPHCAKGSPEISWTSSSNCVGVVVVVVAVVAVVGVGVGVGVGGGGGVGVVVVVV